jgi:hypothetical protein
VIGNRRRQQREHIERETSGCEQRCLHLGEVGIEDVSHCRMQVVRLPELRDPAAIPRVPGVFRRAGHGRAVAFEHHHLVAVL